MKLTIDSAEPLQDALRVVGALYGVRLVVAIDDAEAPPASLAANGAAATEAAEQAHPANPPETQSRTRTARGRSTKKSTVARRRRTFKQATAATSTADIRAWARHNGLTVSDRGRISAAVRSAYRDAHTA